jgi:hypothetical protein
MKRENDFLIELNGFKRMKITDDDNVKTYNVKTYNVNVNRM